VDTVPLNRNEKMNAINVERGIEIGALIHAYSWAVAGNE